MAEIELSMDEDVLEAIPIAVSAILKNYPFITGAETDEELALIEKGECSVCHGQFGEETVILFSGDGILHIVCNPVCLDDQIVAAYLIEKIQDITQSAQFRGEESRKS